MEVTFAFQSHKGLSEDFSSLHSQVGGLNNPESKRLTLQGVLAASKQLRSENYIEGRICLQ